VPTSFASLVADVMTLTNRPDLVNETSLAVRAATLKAHQSDDYIKDLYEYSLQFSLIDYYQSLEYKTVLPLWRKPRYIRKYDASGSGAPGPFLEYVVPEKIMDEYKVDRLDIFYVAGSFVQIRSSTTLEYILVGIYQNPVVTEIGYNSWIADDHPFAIIYEAAATVFKMIGLDDQVPVFRNLVAEQFQLLKQHAVTGIGQ
jgi:hypothetical protein